MTSYRFIFDNNCEKAAKFFPGRRVITLKQARISADATDRKIIEMASERGWIIVTVNGDDFVSKIRQYLKQTTRAKCHDLAGLVILPSGHEIQREALKQIERRLVYQGEQITWKDVWEKDFCVRVKKDGPPQITRFDRCFYCRKNGVA